MELMSWFLVYFTVFVTIFLGHFFPTVKRGLAEEFVACTHIRAHKLFTESIRSGMGNIGCRFMAFKADSWADFQMLDLTTVERTAEMGFNAINYISAPNGNYYLRTNGQTPFCGK